MCLQETCLQSVPTQLKKNPLISPQFQELGASITANFKNGDIAQGSCIGNCSELIDFYLINFSYLSGSLYYVKFNLQIHKLIEFNSQNTYLKELNTQVSNVTMENKITLNHTHS